MKTPKRLKNHGSVFWKKVLTEYAIEDPQDLERLALACEALDRIAEARQRIDTDGAYFVDRWRQPKSHPAMAEIRNFSTLFARLIRELCLDLEQPGETRPPRQY